MTAEFFDNLFRFGAIAYFAWCTIMVLRAPQRLAHPYIIVGATVSTICFLIVTAFDENALFGFFGPVMALIARMAIVLTWLLAITLFKDNFKLQPFHLFILGMYIVRTLIYPFDFLTQDMFAFVSLMMRAILYLYLIYIVISDLSDDLFEKRRTLRLWCVFILIFAPLMASLERVYISNTLYQDHTVLLEAGAAFLLAGILQFYILGLDKESPFFPYAIAPTEKTLHATPKPTSLQLPAADRHSLELLEEKMQAGLYRHPDLNVAKLAEIINVPEHRLRLLINHHLGHRNISQYLNDYRIEEVKKRLADSHERHSSILAIAMDVGYVSLRPFNRAFKNRIGKTPSEYREEQLLAADTTRHDFPTVKN